MTGRRVRSARDFARDEEGVNEVIGFILMFAVSALVLVFSTQAFLTAQENTDHLLRGVELRNMATRVSTHVVQAGLVSEEFPNATFTALMRVPDNVNGQPYRVDLSADKVTASATNSDEYAEATTYNLGAIEHLAVSGGESAERKRFTITYSYDWYATVSGPQRTGDAYNVKLITISKE